MKFRCEIGTNKLHLNKQVFMMSHNTDNSQNRNRSVDHTRNVTNKVFLRESDHGIDKLLISKPAIRDVNSNVANVDHERANVSSSAFRKVEKVDKADSSNPEDEKKRHHSQSAVDEKIDSKFEHDRLSVPPYVSIPMSSKECFVPPNMISSLMMPPNMINNNVNSDIHTSVMDAYGIGLSYPFPVQDSMMRNLESLSPDSRKQYLMGSVLSASIPFTKSANPMVEKILQTSSMAMLHKPLPVLTQSTNWCAKCNTSFRMTSDLVYHMRSHHSKESPTNTKKRDDKLKCNICQETFKERHHLTRHMTSHQ